jgi:hypothetical protein
MRKIMRSDLAPEFAVGILFLKKGMPRPGESALLAASEKTKIVLTTTHPCPPSEFLSRQDLFRELDRTVDEVLSGAYLSESDLFRPMAPSIRANVTDSRSDFGTLGTLVDSGLLTSPLTKMLPYEEFSWNDMTVEQYQHLFKDLNDLDMRNLYSGSVVVRGGGDEIVDGDQDFMEVSPEFKQFVQEKYKKIYLNALELALEEKPDVKLVALAESLKVRVISKGPALTYFVLKPIQKFLHNRLRRLKMFEYIGKPVSAESLTQLLFPRPLTLEQSQNPMLNLLFHSLDYESATDLFDPAVSRRIVDRICDCILPHLSPYLRDSIRTLFHLALTGHFIEGLPQVWGQLMGSIVSFIVLCLANAAVVRASYEASESVRVGLDSFPATVNGDDGLVTASPIFSEIWKSIAASAGLKPSVGKTYSHDVYANINSTSFEFIEETCSLRLIPYVNMGLVYGLKRSGGRADIVEEDGVDSEFSSSIGAIHRQLISTCPAGREVAVHSLFMKENKERLDSVFVPKFVPESKGGLGLASVFQIAEDVDDIVQVAGPTPSDLHCLSLLSTLTHRGLVPCRLPGSQPILCRSLWSSIVPSSGLSSSDCAFMDTATFYLLPSRVMSQKPFDHSKLRRNERAWSLLRRLSHRVMPSAG